MLLVGLTGGIGSGKSSVSKLLRERGAVVVDADRLAREALEPEGAAYGPVVERFGRRILQPDGAIDRAALAAVVFEDPSLRKELEAIVHPVVRAQMAELVLEQAPTDKIVVLDIPLLVESGQYQMAATIVVDCPEDLVVRRLVEQRGMSEEDIRSRMAAQVSRQERLSRADLVIDNSGSPEELSQEVDRAWAWLVDLRDRAGSKKA